HGRRGQIRDRVPEAQEPRDGRSPQGELTMKSRWLIALGALAVWAGAAQLHGCAAGAPGASGTAAQKVYVKPGEHDAYYAFLSGGHHGNVYVYGMPSC